MAEVIGRRRVTGERVPGQYELALMEAIIRCGNHQESGEWCYADDIRVYWDASVSSQGMGARLAALERDGLVERLLDAEFRISRWRLTDKGRDALSVNR